jgi:SAM-dependent methyltransferase
MPPAELRFNVAGAVDEDHFDQAGLRSIDDFNRALASVGRTMTQAQRILEWGCGCGRILRQLPFDPARQEVHGCDIDGKAIGWIQENLPDIQAVQTEGLPPLPYASRHFDLIINHSVLSHLDEDYQDAWLEELRRVLSKDGILILTVHGPHAYAGWVSTLPPGYPVLEDAIEQSKAALDAEGIYFFVDDGWAANFPKFYQSTFHAPWYIFEHWSQYFEILSYIPHGSLGHQDMIVLGHKPPPTAPRASLPGITKEAELAGLRQELDQLRNSTSWRLTRPLRSLASRYRNR